MRSQDFRKLRSLWRIGHHIPPKNVMQPKLRYVNDALAEQDFIKEPAIYKEESQSLKWVRAMEEEMSSLKQNQTWSWC